MAFSLKDLCIRTILDLLTHKVSGRTFRLEAGQLSQDLSLLLLQSLLDRGELNDENLPLFLHPYMSVLHLKYGIHPRHSESFIHSLVEIVGKEFMMFLLYRSARFVVLH